MTINKKLRCVVSLQALFFSSLAVAQVAAPAYNSSSSPTAQSVRATGVFQIDSTGVDSTDTTNHAVKVNVVAGSISGAGAVTVADGADVALGAKADAAYAGTGSASAIATLKGIYSALVAPLPAGTNAIGSITNTGFASTQSGTWTVQPGNTANTTAWLVTGSGGTFPITASSLPLPTGAAVSVAQSSTTSGQSGDLVMGAVTTGVPTYTTGQTNPLSLTTGGALRGDITSINNVATGAGVPNGSTSASLSTFQATALSNTDVNAGAFAGSGSVVGTVIASSRGSGAVVSAEINVSALTLGTATQVFAILQESTGGTNFSDIWVSDPITATGIVRMPAIQVAGRRRWRFFSVGGTSTTVTATITAMELPSGYPLIRQMRDAYAATNPFALQYNSAALAASTMNIASGASGYSTPFYIEGTKQFTVFVNLTGSPTVTTQPVFALQYSMDGINWNGYTLFSTVTGAGVYALSTTGTVWKFVRVGIGVAGVYSSGSYTITNAGVNAVN